MADSLIESDILMKVFYILGQKIDIFQLYVNTELKNILSFLM